MKELMPDMNSRKMLFVVLVLSLSVSCKNGPSTGDDGDEDADAADAEDNGEASVCTNGIEDGFVCAEEPRSICIDGTCVPSVCGDGFVDGGAGESCEPPDAGSCSSSCRWLCETSENCPDDGDMCDGEEYCDTSTHECSQRNSLEDGMVCGADPRRLCIARTCQASICGDRFTDEVLDEECDDGRNGDPDDGCTDACAFSCHDNADCEDDANPCTADICDTLLSHACLHLANPFEMLCRPSAGDCDVEEFCDGVSSVCPDDAVAPPTTECRAPAFQCDAAEYCTGTSIDCPVDVLVSPGTACDDGIFCTLDACDEAGACVGTPTAWLYGVSAIDAGESHTCVLMSKGGVKCWGANVTGQLGDSTTTSRYTPVDVFGLSSGVSAIAVGGGGNEGVGFFGHTCALMSTGGVKCWGYNLYGQVGDGSTTFAITTPVDVSGLSSGVSAVATGLWHTCALMSTGGVKCWGGNSRGQLGDGTTTSRYTPVDVSGLSSGVSAIAAGSKHTCALMSSGGMKCWGDNEHGQVGDGTTTQRRTPVDVSGLSSGVSAISTCTTHTCALMSTGGIKCWGENTIGQLGDGTLTQRLAPVDVSGLSSGVSAIAAGSAHTCALMSTGGVKCWGNNDYGQVGDGSMTILIPTPVDVSGLSSGVSAIAAGGICWADGGFGHTCALLSTGSVKCWGYNDNGQVGDGTITQRRTPTDVLCE
jgi:alpha-tubulin suppressor-like RCC1 family protein